MTFGSDKDPFVARIFLLPWLMNQMFGYIAPMLVSDGLVSILSLLMSEPVIDLTGKVHQFLISSPTPSFSDWSAEFVIGFAISFIAVTLLSAVFLAPHVLALIRF
jgi:hypothetical protein